MLCERAPGNSDGRAECFRGPEGTGGAEEGSEPGPRHTAQDTDTGLRTHAGERRLEAQQGRAPVCRLSLRSLSSPGRACWGITGQAWEGQANPSALQMEWNFPAAHSTQITQFRFKLRRGAVGGWARGARTHSCCHLRSREGTRHQCPLQPWGHRGHHLVTSWSPSCRGGTQSMLQGGGPQVEVSPGTLSVTAGPGALSGTSVRSFLSVKNKQDVGG